MESETGIGKSIDNDIIEEMRLVKQNQILSIEIWVEISENDFF